VEVAGLFYSSSCSYFSSSSDSYFFSYFSSYYSSSSSTFFSSAVGSSSTFSAAFLPRAEPPFLPLADFGATALSSSSFYFFYDFDSVFFRGVV